MEAPSETVVLSFWDVATFLEPYRLPQIAVTLLLAIILEIYIAFRGGSIYGSCSISLLLTFTVLIDLYWSHYLCRTFFTSGGLIAIPAWYYPLWILAFVVFAIMFLIGLSEEWKCKETAWLLRLPVFSFSCFLAAYIMLIPSRVNTDLLDYWLHL